MSYRVISLNPDGTATVTATFPDDLETALAHANANGGEVVSNATVEALVKTGRGQGADPAGGVRLGDFKLHIAEAYLNVAGKDATVQAKWDRLFALLSSNPNDKLVYPAQMPLAGLLLTAVQDDILSAATAQALGVVIPEPDKSQTV